MFSVFFLFAEMIAASRLDAREVLAQGDGDLREFQAASTSRPNYKTRRQQPRKEM